ncbi:hypothetical protein Ddye_019929 [Dipteronia dyeriana]|uniref:Protein kinase domain-containing protein n=1 Tax=Dipteronia dyeriana TaxID=168575 RepID=A0AAD9TZR7_9ROSI|nr:hypothetical protein Ddye_019929 [Dipteronia dyeriana]
MPVLRENGYDGAKSDIWPCGVVLFVLLSGYLPFRHENVMKMYRKIFKAEFVFPPWISMDGQDVDIWASDIIGKLWSEFCRKGKLNVTAEVALVVTEVELSKLAGDSVEYRELCEEDARPALKDVVSSWQGESIN